MPSGRTAGTGGFADADSETRAVSTSMASSAPPAAPGLTPTMPVNQYPPTTVLNEQRLSGTSPP